MLHESYKQYVQENLDYAKELLIKLGRIPSPSNHEEKRAEFVKDWFVSIGAKNVFVDEALNVVLPVNVKKDNPLIAFMAHTDVVFPDTEELPLKEEDGKLFCPGIGDDTANLVGLLLTAKYVLSKGLIPKDGKGFLFIANSGEEGIGNLKGSRRIYETYRRRLEYLCSFDGYLKDVCNDTVGSERYKVEVLTEGGHSYSAFGNRNAIAYLSSMIDTLYELKPPVTNKKTTYNVGRILGGTSVNTIAQQAEMLYEYRSDSLEDLRFMRKHFFAVVESYRCKGIEIHAELIGERPCKDGVNEEELAARTNEVLQIVEEVTGKKPSLTAMSTDCNIPLSKGIPAICTGVISGGNSHTREEYIELNSMLPGYHLAMELVLMHFQE